MKKIIASLVVCLFLCGCANTGGIDEYANEYFKKLEIMDWQGMYSMLNPKAATMSYDDFVRGHERMLDRMGNIKSMKLLKYKTQLFPGKTEKAINYGLECEKGLVQYQIVVEKKGSKFSVSGFQFLLPILDK